MFVTFIIIITLFCQIINIFKFELYRDTRAYILDPCIREFFYRTLIGMSPVAYVGMPVTFAYILVGISFAYDIAKLNLQMIILDSDFNTVSPMYG